MELCFVVKYFFTVSVIFLLLGSACFVGFCYSALSTLFYFLKKLHLHCISYASGVSDPCLSLIVDNRMCCFEMNTDHILCIFTIFPIVLLCHIYMVTVIYYFPGQFFCPCGKCLHSQVLDNVFIFINNFVAVLLYHVKELVSLCLFTYFLCSVYKHVEWFLSRWWCECAISTPCQ